MEVVNDMADAVAEAIKVIKAVIPAINNPTNLFVRLKAFSTV